MSETVWIALITFASGFLGVAVGAYANYKISSLGIKAERGKILHDEKKTAYSEMISAYTDIVETFVDVETGGGRFSEKAQIDSICRFHNAYATVLLLSSEEVREKLNDVGDIVQEGIETRKTPRCTDEFGLLVDAMRNELLSFSYGVTGRMENK